MSDRIAEIGKARFLRRIRRLIALSPLTFGGKSKEIVSFVIACNMTGSRRRVERRCEPLCAYRPNALFG